MVEAGARNADCEYIVVGSGAGGGTVAARLAEAGHSVILLEAGGDPCKLSGGDAIRPDENRLPIDYEVPCFHAFASENEALRWDFFVRHYADQKRQEEDPNYRKEYNGRLVDGVLYPRAGTLGGCTAHNAMIFVYPHDEDWNNIAELTGDESWRAERMRPYFERLENCRYRPFRRLLAMFGYNPTRHGFRGWLSTEKAIPRLTLGNLDLIETILDSAAVAVQEIGDLRKRLRWLLMSMFDPNDDRTDRENAFGIRFLPLTTHRHARMGSRERVIEVSRARPELLRVELNALATRVLFDDDQRAIGVEYRRGERLYRAHAKVSAEDGETRVLRASREVIVCGGAFNTPQLLMLSGIGPGEHLRVHGIPVRVDLPGVGGNLQDRYEIGAVYRMNFERWSLFEGAEFDASDKQFAEWKRHETGTYATNAAALAMFKRSSRKAAAPDLFCVAFLSKFDGYFPGYSKQFVEQQNCLTWAVLKAHTNNRAGRVTLRSSDPRDMPEINFSYFDEGTPDDDQDLDAVVEGLRFVRSISERLMQKGLITREEMPGADVTTDEALRDYVRQRAWGHHASCSCPIGPQDRGGVLDSAFRVHGTKGFRVVDASVFPRIPGFFLACPVYMIGEKAADSILADA